MTPTEARAAVRDQATVRLRYADGGTRAVGRIISYSIVPTVTIELADGTRESWRHDMAEVVAAPTPCPRCNGAGIVDTSPPGVDRHPWLATDTDCPRCGGEGVVDDTDTDTEES